MMNEILDDLTERFEKALETLQRDFGRMRTGRANVALLDGIRVPYYGTPTPLNQVAAINIADARLITVKPWEKNLLTAIEKAIIAADIGINPSNDGDLIRLPIPPLTTERRKDLVKQVKKAGEEAKVAVRNIRRDGNDMVKKTEEFSEDETHRGLQRIQEITDRYIAKVDEAVRVKEKEVLEV